MSEPTKTEDLRAALFAAFLEDPKKVLDLEKEYEVEKYRQVKIDQEKNGFIQHRNGTSFFRDGSELSFDQAFGVSSKDDTERIQRLRKALSL